MNLKFLGDVLDHWKGSIFESLQRGGVLRHFAVDPMASDLAQWTDEDFALYARLLHIDPKQILAHSQSLVDRKAYFREIRHTGDLFLDPDTGVSTGSRLEKQHVAPQEIATLLEADRLVIVYQHVRGCQVEDRVDEVCNAIQEHAHEAQWCSYNSATVAMIFLSRSRGRVKSVRRHFRELLGRHAKGRIRALWT
jgi:hypothetical protein